MSGRGMGTLAIGRRLNLGAHGVVWQRSGHQGDGWSQASVNVLLYRGVQVNLLNLNIDSKKSENGLVTIIKTECYHV